MPLTTTFFTSATPCTSISTSADVIVPVGAGSPAATSAAGVNVYVAVPSAFTTGVTLLQPRKNVPVVVTMLNRGEPPWHWLVLLSVNDADVNVWPVSPVMFAPADAFVVVAQFFSRCSQPFCTTATGHPVWPGSNTPGTSAALAPAANAHAAA